MKQNLRFPNSLGDEESLLASHSGTDNYAAFCINRESSIDKDYYCMYCTVHVRYSKQPFPIHFKKWGVLESWPNKAWVGKGDSHKHTNQIMSALAISSGLQTTLVCMILRVFREDCYRKFPYNFFRNKIYQL